MTDITLIEIYSFGVAGMDRIYFTIKTEIPFMPFVGLSIALYKGGEDPVEVTINSISWDEKMLTCWCGNYQSKDSKEDVIKMMSSDGWTKRD